jgi:lipoprotein signal peptidase
MSHYARTPTAPSLEVGSVRRSGQRLIVLALLAIVVLLDQATKWWGWRHVSGALINAGGPIAGRWYAATFTGRLLDLAGIGFLSLAVLLLVRRRRSLAVLASGALMISGWGSNLVDRLGMHLWTAPGSMRGAVDFLPFGHLRFNLADVFIVGATVMFLLSVGQLRLAAFRRSVVPGNQAFARRRLSSRRQGSRP